MIRLVIAFLIVLTLPARAQVATPTEAALANLDFTLWHETARAALAASGRDLTAGAEAPIFYALDRVTDGDDATDVERLLLVAETWYLSEADGTRPPYLVRNALGQDWARRIVCYVAGEGPGRAHRLLAEWGAPQDAADCASAFASGLEAANQAFLVLPEADTDHPAVQISYADTPTARLAATYEVLEYFPVADVFRWSGPVTLAIQGCGQADATFALKTNTLTVCDELIAYYYNLADGRIGY